MTFLSILLQKYILDRNEWELISEVKLGCRPCRFVVSDDSDVYFYNLEDGTVQVCYFWQDTHPLLNKHGLRNQK